MAGDGVMLGNRQDRAEKNKDNDHDTYKADNKTTDDFATDTEEFIYINNR